MLLQLTLPSVMWLTVTDSVVCIPGLDRTGRGRPVAVCLLGGRLGDGLATPTLTCLISALQVDMKMFPLVVPTRLRILGEIRAP